jgi:hypothetical protein
MRWTVVWNVPVQQDLAEIWLNSTNREAIRAAADQIDKELTNDAHQKGEDFYGDRLLVISPLAVVYSVSNEDRLATNTQVLAAGRYG